MEPLKLHLKFNQLIFKAEDILYIGHLLDELQNLEMKTRVVSTKKKKSIIVFFIGIQSPAPPAITCQTINGATFATFREPYPSAWRFKIIIMSCCTGCSLLIYPTSLLIISSQRLIISKWHAFEVYLNSDIFKYVHTSSNLT